MIKLKNLIIISSLIILLLFIALVVLANEEDTNWLLVALGDSNSRGFGVSNEDTYVQIYANYIEEDLGVKVEVHNWSTNRSRKVSDWTQIIQNDEKINSDLKNAKIVTLWIGWDDVIPAVEMTNKVNLEELDKITSSMENDFDELFSKLVKLANPEQTLILIADIGIHHVFYYEWNKNNTYQTLKYRAYEVWREYLIKSAEKYKIKVVPTYEVLNGPDGNDIISKDYILNDLIHMSEKGHKLIADLHRKMGYSPLK